MGKLNKKMKKTGAGGGGGNKQAMQFNHALGQHILKNPLIIQALVEKVETLEIIPSNKSSTLVRTKKHRHSVGNRTWHGESHS